MPVIEPQQLIGRIQELSKTYAVDSLKSPDDKTTFGYGRHVGVVQGLAMAEELVLKLLNEGKEIREEQRPRPQRAY